MMCPRYRASAGLLGVVAVFSATSAVAASVDVLEAPSGAVDGVIDRTQVTSRQVGSGTDVRVTTERSSLVVTDRTLALDIDIAQRQNIGPVPDASETTDETPANGNRFVFEITESADFEFSTSGDYSNVAGTYRAALTQIADLSPASSVFVARPGERVTSVSFFGNNPRITYFFLPANSFSVGGGPPAIDAAEVQRIIADEPLIDELDFSASGVSTAGTLTPGIYEVFLRVADGTDEQSGGSAFGTIGFRLSTADGGPPSAVPSPTAAVAGLVILPLLGVRRRRG